MPNRLYLLVWDENVFHPAFLDRILAECPPDFVVAGAAIVGVRRGLRADLKHIWDLGGLASIVRLACRVAWRKTHLGLRRDVRRSVRSVLAAHQVPIDETPSPNRPEFVAKLDRMRLDVVFCAVPNILRRPILNLPRLGCVNRHAGRLPDYRGIEPVFHALRRGETSATVSYHRMAEEIDGGAVLWEHDEPVQRRDSVLAIYGRLFVAAEKGFWPAMRNLTNGVGREVRLDQGHYFGHPTRAEILEFRRSLHKYA